jgi:hypothetical protein
LAGGVDANGRQLDGFLVRAEASCQPAQALLMKAGMLALAACLVLLGGPAQAESGVTENEIRIGQTMPYSGPMSSYAASNSAYSVSTARAGSASASCSTISGDCNDHQW